LASKGAGGRVTPAYPNAFHNSKDVCDASQGCRVLLAFAQSGLGKTALGNRECLFFFSFSSLYR
jgi:hypothetical protein